MRIRKKAIKILLVVPLLMFSVMALYNLVTDPYSQASRKAVLGWQIPPDHENVDHRKASDQEQSLTPSPQKQSEEERSITHLPLTLPDDPRPSLVTNFNKSQVFIPGIWTYLPYLGTNTGYLEPRLQISAGRSNATFVFGIPTIKRPVARYVVETVQSLFDNMSEEEIKEVLIILCISEPWNLEYERELLAAFQQRFASRLAQGSLEIIAPHSGFYPDLDQLPQTLGDNKDRVKWRSKQNLDYAFLMMYALGRGKFYMQLEDDISTVKGFVTSIKTTVAKQKGEWILLNFSSLGFIGRLLKQKDVPRVLAFLLMFYSRKPCDWLMEDFLTVHLCPRASCKLEREKQVRLITPTLFQHQGLRSSLEGKINKLKDKYFKNYKVPSGQTVSSHHTNPNAKTVLCSFETHAHYSIKSAYEGKVIFWGKSPQTGDIIEFNYDPSIAINRIAFQSGHKNKLHDIIDHADVEALPESIPSSSSNIPYKPVNRSAPVRGGSKQSPQVPYYTIGSFDKKGDADVRLDAKFGKISSLRIRFTHDYNHWVILDQIAVLLVGD